MPKRIQPLSDIQVKKAKPKNKEYKLSDGFGLYLLVTPTGGKLWRMQYRYADKQKLLSFGPYPSVSLADGRQRREDARKLLANGIDPSETKKAEKAAQVLAAVNSFEAVAREWHERNKSSWAESYSAGTMRRLEMDVFPFIGARPIAEITPPELLKVLRRIEVRGAINIEHRVRSICSTVFQDAIASGRAERDPAADLKRTMKKVNKDNLAAITDPKEVAGLLRAIDSFPGSFVVKKALQLSSLVFVRPGELRHAEWREIDIDAAEWNIPAEKMKMKVEHLVPLSHQAVEILQEIYPLTGHGRYVFPNAWSSIKPMSECAILAALRRLGYSKDEMTAHGFRAMARTILDEVLQVRPDFIEHQLAHAVRDPNGRAYNRTAHLAERRKMMQLWADYLDGLKAGAKVLPIRNIA